MKYRVARHVRVVLQRRAEPGHMAVPQRPDTPARSGGRATLVRTIPTACAVCGHPDPSQGIAAGDEQRTLPHDLRHAHARQHARTLANFREA